ncbi:MAG: hypothetical protein HY001_00070 [Candidatus Portnoybacteria bacterium]|nr:hypothetical protein [Candidatus Portnoybacteria bacterium]
MNFSEAKRIMQRNFIGPDELNAIANAMGIHSPNDVPEIPFSGELLQREANNYLLMLGTAKNKNGESLTLATMRAYFGWDPGQKEPCFYNQDWYLNEPFANQTTLAPNWYLIRKTIKEGTRGKEPATIALPANQQLPSALLTAFTFFAYYFVTNGEILWKHDFVWCSDTDSNGDQIYTGRYVDPKGINKNGFNVHRHLSIKPHYGCAPQQV